MGRGSQKSSKTHGFFKVSEGSQERLGASWGRLGVSFGRLGGALGRLGGDLGASWSFLGTSVRVLGLGNQKSAKTHQFFEVSGGS